MAYNWSGFFSNNIRDLEECFTVKATYRAHTQRAISDGVSDLSIGDPRFDTPAHVKQAAVEAIGKNDTHYTDIGGSRECREAVAAKFREENNLECTADNVIVSNGAGQVICNAMMATLEPGDEVIIPLPHWDNYTDMTRLHHAVPVFLYSQGNFKVTPEQLAAAITPRTKWFILTNPNNPGGRVYSNDELKAFAEVLQKPEYSHVCVIADEAFEHVIFGEKPISFGTIESMKDRTLTVNGASKPFSMTGWRIGYGTGPEPLIRKMRVVQSNTTYSPCSVAQAAIISALKPEYRPQIVAHIGVVRESRDLACSLMEQVKSVTFLKPDAGYFIFLNISNLINCQRPDTGAIFKTSGDVCDYLFDHAKVSVVDGRGFGVENYIRIVYAAPKPYIESGYARIVTALNEIKVKV